MIVAQAPLQLPFAPKPFRRELFSSWLLRLAAANCVTLEELLAGFQASYPSAPYAFSLDVNLDDGLFRFMARFSRESFKTLSRLSLEKQVSNPEAALLLRFNNNSSGSRLLSRRLGYAFCPYCIHTKALSTCRGNGHSPACCTAPSTAPHLGSVARRADTWTLCRSA
jgi:TniQ